MNNRIGLILKDALKAELIGGFEAVAIYGAAVAWKPTQEDIASYGTLALEALEDLRSVVEEEDIEGERS